MAKRHSIRTKRVYDAPEARDGRRFLVDGLWPRGVSRESARIEAWLREVAPSDGLRKWFAHEPAKWEEFRRRYALELEAKEATWRPIMEALAKGDVTLVFAAKDAQHSNAEALRGYLEGKRG